MSELRIRPLDSLGYDFIAGPYLPEGKDENYLRNEQSPRPADSYRQLRPDEIELLVRNGNTADRWDNILITDPFEPDLIAHCSFHGLVRIGRLEEVALEHHEITVPTGITHSRLIACDIGDDVAIHNVRYLAHHIIGDQCILLNLDEMHTTNHAKFGSGIVKDGETEETRIWLDLINEAGGRSVMPFDGMTAGDAYLWAKFRDDTDLMDRLGEITQASFDSRRGYYGTVGRHCVIKNCRIIKDVRFGDNCYVKGASKLKNLTVNSTEDEPTQIGEGVELVNGIIGAGCRIFYGCKAVRFVLGPNSNLKYGARLIHSYLGDNSTVSCCEILNNLVFPAHEQHHNNSFLIASLVLGQSNVAAGATIGSNHNSRAADGEIQAGRGFWPGLCVSVKHNCRFASFVLLAKGHYPAEMDVPLPFSLVTNDIADDRLCIMPAYAWRHNMYALARNAWKIRDRDSRQVKIQNIEFEPFAPDTAEEMLTALTLLERWTGCAQVRRDGGDPDSKSPEELSRLGRQLLEGPAEGMADLQVLADRIEYSRRVVLILRPHEGYRAYRDMLFYYAVRNLIDWLDADEDRDLAAMSQTLIGPRNKDWINLGGQLVRSVDLDGLLTGIKTGQLDSWSDIHAACDELWRDYPLDKQRHASAVLLELLGTDDLSPELWLGALNRVIEIQEYVADQTYRTRAKDYDNPARQITYRSKAEKDAVIGQLSDNPLVQQVRQRTEDFRRRVEKLRKRL